MCSSDLLIEAGGVPKQREAGIPAAFSKLFKGPLDWDLSTVPQPALDGRELYWPRGRALGGSSVINAMMWVRGHRADYDAWRDAGCAGWGYDDVLPYFQRAERRSPDDGDGAHGTEGPLHIQDHRDPNVTTAAFLEACAEIGLERKPHHNTGDHEGYAPTIVNERRGKRWSTYDGYLKPAMRRGNLEVLTGLTVDRVIVEGGRARGVRAIDAAGQERTVVAEREVILAAGAVASPTILITPSVPSSCTGVGSCTVTFVVQVTPPTGVGVVSANIDFGDSVVSGLGGLSGSATVPHTYAAGVHGGQTVTVTVVDTIGRTTQGFTTVVLP